MPSVNSVRHSTYATKLVLILSNDIRSSRVKQEHHLEHHSKMISVLGSEKRRATNPVGDESYL